MMLRRTLFVGLAQTLLSVLPVTAEETPTESNSVLAGHSLHGEAFNAGPRQAAELIPGMAKIDFPTSTESETAQEFIEQGIAQLHGFWYLEAERSFRQAAKEDPDLAITYWGMALANVNNDDRARGLIDEAMQRRKKGADKREKMYIEALNRLILKEKKDEEKKDEDKQDENGDDKDDDKSKEDKEADREAKKKRIIRYIADLEKILHEFPDDVEAKAFLAVNLWTGDRAGVKLASHYAVSALLGEVFAHHYRIHLWDSPRSENAIESAAKCGPSSPGIAHMWHMPGHIYSKLKRYGDAAWQQEASARVDHAHMIRTRLMPDEIHNFAHNNEWLIRNLLYVGRVNDALALSRNLISLPRHPKYNSLEKGGSYKYGRQRLLQTLTEYGLWQELIAEAQTHYTGASHDDTHVLNQAQKTEWLGWLASAHFMTDDSAKGAATLRTLRRQRIALQNQILDLADAGENAVVKDESANDESPPTRKELKKQIAQIRRAIARGAAASATKRKDVEKLKRHLEKAKLNQLIQAQWLAEGGDLEGAIELAEKATKKGKGQVRPLAVLADLHWRTGDKKKAVKKFKLLRNVAGAADIETPMLAKLVPVATESEAEGDWRIKPDPADDLGDRPPLDELGPFRWQPYVAPSWTASTADGEPISSEEFTGKPRIVIFYLGFGCLHCVEQLHEFAPRLADFKASGIDLVGISTESVEDLRTGISNFKKKMDIPLLSDAPTQAFKSFRTWDDFEDQPLHGTFLIDGQNRVRWQDIGYEPFTDVDFLLEESKRLLSLP